MNAAAPPSRRVFWPRLRLLLAVTAAALALAVVALPGVRAYLLWQIEARLQVLVAQTDEVDPRWRWDDVVADRREVPDDQNSALRVLAAAERMPDSWPPPRPAIQQVVFDHSQQEQQTVAVLAGVGALTGLARVETKARPNWSRELSRRPEEPLPADLVAELRAELAQRGEALTLARQVAGLPHGRYPITYDRTIFLTKVPHTGRMQLIGFLLNYDLALAVAEGDQPRAVLDCRALLDLGRSFGDEPFLICLLLRLVASRMATSGLERILAHGDLSEADLGALRQSLWRPEDETAFEESVRDERALYFVLSEKVYRDEVTLPEVNGARRSDDPASRFYRWAWERPLVRADQAAVLEWMTSGLAQARLRGAARLNGLDEWRAGLRPQGQSSPITRLGLNLIADLARVAPEVHRDQANVQSCLVAVALERYRHRHGRWPEALAELVPAFLARVPDDPFADAPLRYARTATGVVVYSVGRNNKDNGGEVFDESGKPLDFGVRLLDPERRRPEQGKTP